MNQAPAPRGNTMDSDFARQGRRFCSPDEWRRCLSEEHEGGCYGGGVGGQAARPMQRWGLLERRPELQTS